MAVTTASGRNKQRRLVRFTANTSFTVPQGVYYVRVEACGGGAGGTNNNAGASGSNTTVALSGVTITGPGMTSNPQQPARDGAFSIGNGTANTGESARRAAMTITGAGGEGSGGVHEDNRGYVVSAGGPVLPGATVAVVIGSGGAGTGTGASGFANIYYEV